METSKMTETAHIGRSVVIKGELSGSEDLYVDGRVEGNIELRSNSLTVGPNGQLRANVNAKNALLQGKVEGNVRASGRVELTKSAVLVGDIFAQRIAIEEGAFFKGKVDIQKEVSREAPKGVMPLPPKTESAGGTLEPEKKLAAQAGVTGSSASSSPPTGAAQTPVTDTKKF